MTLYIKITTNDLHNDTLY